LQENGYSPPVMTSRLARAATSLGLAAALNLSVAGTVALVALTPSTACAQGKVSTQKLIDDAKAKFEDQQYDESIQKLSAALLRPDATRAQKIEVYRWLAYNYIVLKQDESARTAIYALYALDENYALPKTESPKFREPFKKYKDQWIDEGKPGQAKEEKAAAAVVIKHLPPAQAPHDQSIAITGSFDDPEQRVAKLSLFYRSGSAGKFVEVAAAISANTFRASIPGSAVKPPLVEYYVQASDKGGLAVTSRGDAETPLRIAVQAEQEKSIFGTWWFWAGTTAVVAGGVVAGFLLTRKKDNGPGPTNSTVTVTIGE
jgi:hypothetical protein